MQKIFKVSGRQEDIDTVAHLLRHIEYLGDIGASRNIIVRVDGDGQGRIKVRDELDSPINTDKYNTEQGHSAVVAVYDIG